MLFQQVAPVAPPGLLADLTNVGITLVIVAGLVFARFPRSILDGSGIIRPTLLGVVVGLAGHWSRLVLLLTFLLSGHLVTMALDEKLSYGDGESSMGIAHGAMSSQMACRAQWPPSRPGGRPSGSARRNR